MNGNHRQLFFPLVAFFVSLPSCAQKDRHSRMNSDTRNRVKQPRELSPLDRHGDGDAQAQFATIRVGLNFMSLLS